MTELVDVQRIEQAVGMIAPTFRDTPQYVCDELGDALDLRPLLKVETVNPVRSFKGRGADLLARRTPSSVALVCASTGNLGYALAHVAGKYGVRVEIFASSMTDQTRLFQLESFGANVHLVLGDHDAARRDARAAAERTGWKFVEEGTEPAFVEGGGTIGAELTGFDGTIDHVLVPVGHGSSICGIAAWFNAVSPSTRVVAVGSTGAPAMERAWRTGDLESDGPTKTMAEGLAVREPVAETVRAMRRSVDAYVLVDDELLSVAARLLRTCSRLVAEPAGAAGIAGALSMADELRGTTVALPVGGANVDSEALEREY
ncbi:threonine ammonia-lyase [Parasphingorhabdus pacifica]